MSSAVGVSRIRAFDQSLVYLTCRACRVSSRATSSLDNWSTNQARTSVFLNLSLRATNFHSSYNSEASSSMRSLPRSTTPPSRTVSSFKRFSRLDRAIRRRRQVLLSPLTYLRTVRLLLGYLSTVRANRPRQRDHIPPKTPQFPLSQVPAFDRIKLTAHGHLALNLRVPFLQRPSLTILSNRSRFRISRILRLSRPAHQ